MKVEITTNGDGTRDVCLSGDMTWMNPEEWVRFAEVVTAEVQSEDMDPRRVVLGADNYTGYE